MRAFIAVLSLSVLLLLVATSSGATQQDPDTVSIVLTGDADELPEAQSQADAELDKACPPHFTREYWPVCGLDGTTYRKFANKSIFAYHQCRAQKLHGAAMTLVDMCFCPDADGPDADAFRGDAR
jgi:hypothetical protein